MSFDELTPAARAAIEAQAREHAKLCQPVESGHDARRAVRSMVTEMIAEAIQEERARIAQILRSAAMPREQLPHPDPHCPFTVDGPVDVSAVFEAIARAIESES